MTVPKTALLIAALAVGFTAFSMLSPGDSGGIERADDEPSASFEPTPAYGWAPRQEANQDLDQMAQALAQLAATPGFRGFIRSEIARTRNREAILELEPFIERASRRPDAPPGLSEFGALRQNARARFSSQVEDFKGFDLYIPVEAHRTKWRGGDDFVVAFAPVGDDQEIKEIVAYSVRNGEKVVLDAAKAPDTVVLIVAPCEHETHEQEIEAERVSPEDRVLPEAHVTGREPAEAPVEQTEGNSYVGLRRLYIRDVKEPWYRGDAEIMLWFAQRKGNYCEERWIYYKGTYLERVNDDRVWYSTWPAPHTGECGRKTTCFYFTEQYPTKMNIRLYEVDGGASRSYVFDLYPGVSCQFVYRADDDYVDHGWMYRNNFPFAYDYNQDLGNAYVKWHKVH